MSIAEPPPPSKTMTAEVLMGLPEDGIHRELIRGELRESPMTFRNRKHSRVEARITHILGNWLDARPGPKGAVVCGDAAFRLKCDPETLVGVDVAYASADVVAATTRKTAFYDGPPVLAVEILSPSDRQKDVVEKVGLYLEVGTVVWVVDPDFRTVTVHRAGHEAEAFNANQELSGEPELPGFRVRVAEFFP
jgi:Uma2 family endonuclease